MRAIVEHEPAPAFVRFRMEARAAATPLEAEDRRRLLPDLLHLQAVRLCGARREDEIRALYLWQRTLAGVDARARRARR
jgi:hypothetical protein